ncbi:hypothetical protein JOQ06_018842 [Pogonophryne albipinna]|uniref:Uncharacterized protein n=1 Tax=Pogonophryne albipinna TaxID=1090488 RepID=A0AAD6ARS3_9TELE|nr:hypothetical protein JOQ06_018842 [Pogonophryne albipinna]
MNQLRRVGHTADENEKGGNVWEGIGNVFDYPYMGKKYIFTFVNALINAPQTAITLQEQSGNNGTLFLDCFQWYS